jgi:RHS repeat-associated protein
MQGQYDDGEIGLYYNTFRYYDYDAGRFATEDPIGLAGGDNLYQYAQNPLRWADPLGLEAASIAIGGAAWGLGGGTAGAGAALAATAPFVLGTILLGGCAYGAYWLYTQMNEPSKPEPMEAKGGEQRGGAYGARSDVVRDVKYATMGDPHNQDKICKEFERRVAELAAEGSPLTPQQYIATSKQLGCHGRGKR